jgi:hypothetical protein
MHRRLLLVGVLAMSLAACGGSSGSPSPSASGSHAPSAAPQASTSAAPQESAASPTDSASASQDASGSAMTAICDGISLRKKPASSGARVKVIGSGTAVHVVGTVDGTAYKAGTCGTAGSSWIKIDEVGGKSVKSSYGVPFVYAAAGFFQ